MAVKSHMAKRLIFWTTILLAALIIPLHFDEEAKAAISYVDSAPNPANNGTYNDETVDVDPSSISMQQGDFVLLIGAERSHTGSDLTISNTGGQSWTTLDQAPSEIAMKSRLFYCIFNGTWTANPSIIGNSGVTKSAIMHVFRGVDQATPLDVAQTVGTTPYEDPDKTIDGITTNTDGAWVIAVWTASWSGSWALSTSGWDNAGLAGYNNIVTGAKLSVSAAYKELASHGASGDVTNTTDAGDGTSHILALKMATGSLTLGGRPCM